MGRKRRFAILVLLGLAALVDALPVHRHEDSGEHLSVSNCPLRGQAAADHLHSAEPYSVEFCGLAVALAGFALPAPAPGLGFLDRRGTSISPLDEVGASFGSQEPGAPRGPPVSLSIA